MAGLANLRLRLRLLRTLAGIAIAIAAFAAPAAPAAAAPVYGVTSGTSSCGLNNGVQHVIYIQFDNVHLRRDAAAVPSDLEQMPNLLNFLENNGVMMNRHYTPLIAHTADDIVSSLSGLYGDRQGIPEANSYGFYQGPDAAFQSSFGYWTTRIGDGTFNNLDSNGQNSPAPWTPYTKAGCSVGEVGSANTELEDPSEISLVYGAGSPQAAETGEAPYADFLGISVHCARGAAICATNGVADRLPSDPSYSGYQALYGHKYVAPQIGGSGPGGVNLNDLNGNLIADTFTGTPIPGFPGYDGLTAPVSLAYTLDMQTHGIPVTHTYISAAHVDPSTGNDAGPGSAGYESRLKSYDQAFGAFFSQLAASGITTQNTLFVVTADENDQFVGGAGAPAGCDGVNVACSYNQIGEVDVNLDKLLQQSGGATTPYSIHYDSAPFVYLQNQPASAGAKVRDFERSVAALQVENPITSRTETLINYFADPVEMKLLHMVTADANRTPSFVAFGKSSYWIQTQPAFCQSKGANPAPVIECAPSFGADAWMHGTFDPQINQGWIGFAGPGVRNLGFNDTIWSDHTDVLPTILSLAGLQPTYALEGRVLFEISKSVFPNESTLVSLGQSFKQINAPAGPLGSDSLRYATKGIVSGNDASDSLYGQVESNIASITSQRDTLAAEMEIELTAAAFAGQTVNSSTANAQVQQANELLNEMHQLAG